MKRTPVLICPLVNRCRYEIETYIPFVIMTNFRHSPMIWIYNRFEKNHSADILVVIRKKLWPHCLDSLDHLNALVTFIWVLLVLNFFMVISRCLVQNCIKYVPFFWTTAESNQNIGMMMIRLKNILNLQTLIETLINLLKY